MAGVMSRLGYRQAAPASGSDYYGGGGAGVQVSAQTGVGASVDAGGSARVTGVVVLVALAVIWIGYHGLKGG